LTVLDRGEIWRSLDTDSLSVAVRRLHGVAASVEADFERARLVRGAEIDPALLSARLDSRATTMPETQATGAHVVADISAATIGEVYDRYIADPRHVWTKRTITSHTTTRKWVIEAFGSETPLQAVTREGCREFVDLLRRMPRHADKRFPGMPIREVVTAAKARGETRLINTANLNAYVNRFGGLLNWAIDEGYLDRNPVRGLKLPDPIRKRDKRRPFSVQQLGRIFNAPIYRGCENDENGYAVPGSERPRRARFWVPLIGLFSGLRMNEICQLEVTDIVEIDDVPCFRVAPGVSDTGQQKRVKTAASERIVPIHAELIRFGFLVFVASQKLRGESSLFPELPLGHLGYRSTSLSRWFSRFLERADATAPLTCFHSFRHNFRDGLREAKVNRDVGLVLGGWTTDGKGQAVADNYGSGYSAPVLAEALNAVRFPAVNLDHLSVVGASQNL
jgi:integrase